MTNNIWNASVRCDTEFYILHHLTVLANSQRSSVEDLSTNIKITNCILLVTRMNAMLFFELLWKKSHYIDNRRFYGYMMTIIIVWNCIFWKEWIILKCYSGWWWEIPFYSLNLNLINHNRIYTHDYVHLDATVSLDEDRLEMITYTLNVDNV